MLDVTTTLEDVLYSPIEPYDAGMLTRFGITYDCLGEKWKP